MVWQTDILTSIWRGCSKIKCDKADTSPGRLCLGWSKGSTNMTGHPVPPSVKDWWPPHLGMLSANDRQLSAPSRILSGHGHDTALGSSHPVTGHCGGIRTLATGPESELSCWGHFSSSLNFRSATSVTVPYISFLPADSCFFLLSATRVGSKGTPR